MKAIVYFLISFYGYCINYFVNYAGCCCKKKPVQNNNQNNDQGKDKFLSYKGKFDKGTFIGGTGKPKKDDKKEEHKKEEHKKEEHKKEEHKKEEHKKDEPKKKESKKDVEKKTLEQMHNVKVQKQKELEEQIKPLNESINAFINDIESKVKLIIDSINKITKKDLKEKYLKEINSINKDFNKNKDEYKKLQGNGINEKVLNELEDFNAYFCELEENLKDINLEIDKIKQNEEEEEKTKKEKLERERQEKEKQQKELEEEEKRKKELEKQEREKQQKLEREKQQEKERLQKLEEEARRQKEKEDAEKKKKEEEEINKKINEFNVAREKLEKEIEDILKYIDDHLKELKSKVIEFKEKYDLVGVNVGTVCNEIESSLKTYFEECGKIKDSYRKVKGKKLGGINILDEYNKSLENFKLIENEANHLKNKLMEFNEYLDEEFKKLEEEEKKKKLKEEEVRRQKEEEENRKRLKKEEEEKKKKELEDVEKEQEKINVLKKEIEEKNNLINGIIRVIKIKINSIEECSEIIKNENQNDINNYKKEFNEYEKEKNEILIKYRTVNEDYDKVKGENLEKIKILEEKYDNLKNKINSIQKNFATLGKKLYDLEKMLKKKNKAIEIDKKEEYSYDCTNSMYLTVYIYTGTESAEFEIFLKNSGDKKWPDDSKLIVDNNSDLFPEEVRLDAQKPNEEKSYKVTLKDLEGKAAGEYNIYFSFHSGGKIYGERIHALIKIKEKDDEKNEIDENIDKINEFRETFNLTEEEYSDEKILDILKENDFNFENAFSALFN